MNTNLFLILWLNESRDAKIYSVVDPGEAAPLIFGPNWGLKGRKNFLETAPPPPPPFSKGLDDRHLPLVSQCLDPALLN